jgi:DNA-binding GntR family transcriptional regulator
MIKNLFMQKKLLFRNISHSEDKKTSLHKITISVSAFPSLSEQIAESIYNSIIAYSNEVTNVKGKEKRKFIESRLLTVQLKLI